jgi:hypothetical protein
LLEEDSRAWLAFALAVRFPMVDGKRDSL